MAKKKPAAATPPKPPAKTDWDRDQFTARLTPARRARLRQLAATLTDGLTPVEVVDRALEMALQAESSSSGGSVAKLIEFEERLSACAAELTNEVRSASALARQTSDEVRGLSELISAVAGSSDASPPPADGLEREVGQGAPSLRSWLDARGASHQTIKAVARWRSKSRLTDRMIAMEFEIGMASPAGPRSLAKIEPLDIASPFASTDAAAQLLFECRRDPRGGWLVAARKLNADRTLGEPLGQIKV